MEAEVAVRPDLGSVALGLSAQAEVRRVGRILSSSGVTALCLSGPTVHVRLHGGAGGSARASLALLVPASHGKRAHRALVAAGWRRTAGRYADRSFEHEGLRVQIHSRLPADPISRWLLRPLLRALWADARPGPDGLLEPGSQALVVCLLAGQAAGARDLVGGPGDLEAALGSVVDLAALERLALACRLRGALQRVETGGPGHAGGARFDGWWAAIGVGTALVRRSRSNSVLPATDRWVRRGLAAVRHRPDPEATATFRGLELRYPVGTVFPPRALTEPLVDLALERLDERSPALVIDVGTGSGAVALSLADERPAITILGIDVAHEAVDCARRNAARLAIGNVRFRQGHLLEPVPPTWVGRVWLITSNIPFVAPREGDLVRRHGFPEGTAIGPAVDGLGLVRDLFAEASTVLQPGGRVVAQLEPWHWEALGPLLHDLGFEIEQLRPSMGAMLGRARKT
jgi:release factor glutamine methyltransferase